MPAFLLMSETTGAAIAGALLAIFVSAKVLAEIFERMRLPGIAGEILAGILIGPQMLNWVRPSEVVSVLSELGVMFLLFRVGLEVRPSELTSIGGQAALVAASGVVLPFAAGWGLAAWYNLSRVEAMFIGAALVATSVGITARVLASGGWLSQRASKLILAAAVIDDVLGLLVLAAVSSIARGAVNWTEIGITAMVAGGFTLLVATIGARALKRVVPAVNRSLRLVESEFALSIGLLFALALLASYAGVAAIIGAFLAGMALSETVDRRVHELTEGVTELLVPFFLVGIGLNFDISTLSSRSAIVFATLVFIAATLSKFLGCGAAALPLGKVDAIRIGVGMIPRGEVGMVVAQIGLSFGVVDPAVYGTIVLMSVATTLIAPSLLRMAFRKSSSRPAEEEEALQIG
jgi:Kef-type K+ transport system membrane component KefB